MFTDPLGSGPRHFLRTVDLSSALGYIAKCSLAIWQQPLDITQFRHEETVGGIVRLSRYYDTPLLAYIASEIIANSRGTEPFDVGKFNHLLDLINSQPVSDEGRADRPFRAIQLFLSTAYPQIAIPGSSRLINRFGRYWLLYTGIPGQPNTGIADFAQQLPRPFNRVRLYGFWQ
jgi:hypothetical protein